MIPIFPNLKKLDIRDKKDIEVITAQFLPYSDFNFTSMWSYNVADDIVISRLNDNLVVRFRDYISNEPFFSFIGSNKPNETAKVLLDYSISAHMMPILKLVPKDNYSVVQPHTHIFSISDDLDNYDYIYSTEELAELKGTKYEKKRNHIHKFTKMYSDTESQLLDISDPIIQSELFTLFETWEQNKLKTKKETEHELIAIKRLLMHAVKLNIMALGFRHKKKLVAFTLVEMTLDNYGVFHFTKANTSYKGAYTMLYHLLAKELHKRGCRHLNREQDLGIEGLRIAKKSWNPVHYLEKYVIGYKTL